MELEEREGLGVGVEGELEEVGSGGPCQGLCTWEKTRMTILPVVCCIMPFVYNLENEI